MWIGGSNLSHAKGDNLNMVKYFTLFICFLSLIVLIGCNNQDSTLTLLKLDEETQSIDKITIALAMGNPKYGTTTKTFIKKDDIAQIIEIMHTAIIKNKVKPEDVVDSGISNYLFYIGDEVVYSINFNGDDSTRVWIGSTLYHVEYVDRTPFELYNESSINEVIIDADTKDNLN
jgi:hypothetical protein